LRIKFPPTSHFVPASKEVWLRPPRMLNSKLKLKFYLAVSCSLKVDAQDKMPGHLLCSGWAQRKQHCKAPPCCLFLSCCYSRLRLWRWPCRSHCQRECVRRAQEQSRRDSATVSGRERGTRSESPAPPADRTLSTPR
jgi:hypothetical protein